MLNMPRRLIPLLALVAAGCAMDHVRGDDASGSGDAGPTPCPLGATPLACVSIDVSHVCGHASSSAVCIGGSWQCPSGTSSSTDCWCFDLPPHDARCVCTRSGWQCPNPPIDPIDAGLDAASACPADPRSVQGMRCDAEGQTCGVCANPCGDCNQVTCVGHVWQGIDTGCAEITFACGPTRACDRFAQFCQHVLSDVAGMPDEWVCLPIPSGCTSESCACFDMLPAGERCTSDGAGALTVTLGGG